MSFVDTWSVDRRSVTTTCRACRTDSPPHRASDPHPRRDWKRKHATECPASPANEARTRGGAA